MNCGHFCGSSSSHQQVFIRHERSTNFIHFFLHIFFTLLTLNCLNGVSGISKHRAKLLLLLLQHSSDVCFVTLSLKHEAGFLCGTLKTCCCSIFHRPPLKGLCWSRPKKSPCDPKTWRECSRTTQRTSWSGSPKVEEVSWIKKTLKHVFISVFLRFLLVDSFLHTNTLSPLPLRFLLLFAVFHYPEKRRWRHTHMTQYDFTADCNFSSNKLKYCGGENIWISIQIWF